MSDQPIARILVVDDDEVLRTLTAAELENAGFEVLEASDAQALLARVDVEQPDLVLLDVMMPGIDGFAACQLLRAEPRHVHLPVLMMTGLDGAHSINRAYEVGATDFVTKPIVFDLLSHRLRYILRAKATADRLRASEARLVQAQQIARLGYWECDADGRFLPWDAATLSILGVPEGTRVEDIRRLGAFLSAPDRAALIDAFMRATRTGEVFSCEFNLESPGLAHRTVHLVGMPEAGPDGRYRFVGTLQDVSERRRAEREIHRLEFVDELTGLPNRAAMRARLVQALGAASRQGRTLAVMSLDIDHFQRINDSLGFAAADRLLEAIARRLCETLRASDVVGQVPAQNAIRDSIARNTGDEFIVLLPEIASAEHAAVVAQRLRAALAAPFDSNGKEIFVSASLGIAVYPDNGASADDLLKHAATALAHAKREGNDGYRFYTGELNERASRRLTMEMELRRALEREQFEVFYQPKVSTNDLSVRGFEALLRWNHPELGRVAPGEFIRIAEETGLIIPIGEWVLATACAQLAAWERQGHGSFRCAVNLSAAQFRVAKLHQRVADIVTRAGLHPQRIEIELTESMLMDDADAAVRVLENLNAHGFGIAIDDFGTGYSSLSYLKRFPLDVLKVDRSFVCDLPGDKEDAAIVQTVISMARGLDLKVVAEGVETAAQYAFLRERACDELQGYLFSPPFAASELLPWLQRHAASDYCASGGMPVDAVRVRAG